MAIKQTQPQSIEKRPLGRKKEKKKESQAYDKLEALVDYHKAKSASDYLENLIIKEWEKMQRKLRS